MLHGACHFLVQLNNFQFSLLCIFFWDCLCLLSIHCLTVFFFSPIPNHLSSHWAIFMVYCLFVPLSFRPSITHYYHSFFFTFSILISFFLAGTESSPSFYNYQMWCGTLHQIHVFRSQKISSSKIVWHFWKVRCPNLSNIFGYYKFQHTKNLQKKTINLVTIWRVASNFNCYQ